MKNQHLHSLVWTLFHDIHLPNIEDRREGEWGRREEGGGRREGEGEGEWWREKGGREKNETAMGAELERGTFWCFTLTG